MNCKTAERQMALAVGEDLAPVESQELQGHLESCMKCQKTWEQQQQGFAVLQRSRTHEIPRKSDSVWPALVNRLRERNAESPRSEFNGWFAGLAVTAACVLVFVFSQESSTPMALNSPSTGKAIDLRTVDLPDGSGKSFLPNHSRGEDQARPHYNDAQGPSSKRP